MRTDRHDKANKRLKFLDHKEELLNLHNSPNICSFSSSSFSSSSSSSPPPPSSSSSSSSSPSSSSSSSSGATTSMFEMFDLLMYFLSFNLILDAICPIIYFHNS
jgi:hypothetical protein